MLTDKERKWLEFRKDVCFRCKKRRQTCSLSLREDCRKAGYPIRDLAMVIPPDYRDVAEFEAQVQRALMYQYEKAYHCKDVSGSFMPDRDTMLMYARLAVEEEMDE